MTDLCIKVPHCCMEKAVRIIVKVKDVFLLGTSLQLQGFSGWKLLYIFLSLSCRSVVTLQCSGSEAVLEK